MVTASHHEHAGAVDRATRQRAVLRPSCAPVDDLQVVGWGASTPTLPEGDRAELRSRWFRFDPTGAYVGTQRVRRTMKLSHNRERFSATHVIEVIAPSGAVVATLHATESGTLVAG